MKISLRPQHLKRYKELLQLLFKYGDPEMVRHFELEQSLTEEELKAVGADTHKPEELAEDLERMGPTYVKLGQILSSRPDLVPDAYLKALTRLQDKVKPFPFEEVEKTVQTELGARISKAFSEFETEPLAAASLGQVHRAALRDGRQVVVKVQRPEIRKQIAEDMEVIDEIVSFLNKHTRFGRQFQIHKLFEEFQRTLRHELDYQREAINMTVLAENLEEFPLIQVPLPVENYTTRSVLTMDYIRGRKITKLSPLIRLDLKGEQLAEELFKAYLKQVLVDGIFHADPHPGNVFLTDDYRIALLDVGMVGRTTPAMQERLLKLLLAVSEINGDEAAEIIIQTSERTEEFDENELRRRINTLLSEHQNQRLHQIDLGRIILDFTRSAGQSGLYVPTELALLGKTLLQLDEIGRFLYPEFNPTAAVRRNVTEILNRRMFKDFTPAKLFTSLLDIKSFMGGMPSKLSRILDAVADAELELNVKATDINLFISGIQKIANRITAGLILAALIVGASLLMQIETEFQLFDYPGLAIICFLMAAGMGLWLVVSILIKDHRDRDLSEKSKHHHKHHH
jgi:ubiquinone biosynthesis protein